MHAHTYILFTTMQPCTSLFLRLHAHTIHHALSRYLFPSLPRHPLYLSHTHNHARQIYTHARLHPLSLLRNHQAHALGVDYVLQVEPDVRPIRAGWLSQAATLAAGYEQLLPPEGAQSKIDYLFTLFLVDIVLGALPVCVHTNIVVRAKPCLPSPTPPTKASGCWAAHQERQQCRRPSGWRSACISMATPSITLAAPHLWRFWTAWRKTKPTTARGRCVGA